MQSNRYLSLMKGFGLLVCFMMLPIMSASAADRSDEDKALSARLADGRLANIERLDVAIIDASLEAGSIDFVMTALNFHDVYNSEGAEFAVTLRKPE